MTHNHQLLDSFSPHLVSFLFIPLITVNSAVLARYYQYKGFLPFTSYPLFYRFNAQRPKSLISSTCILVLIYSPVLYKVGVRMEYTLEPFGRSYCGDGPPRRILHTSGRSCTGMPYAQSPGNCSIASVGVGIQRCWSRRIRPQHERTRRPGASAHQCFLVK